MKRFLLLLAILYSLTFFAPMHSLAIEENVNNLIFIVINDHLVSFRDVYPEVYQGKTYVPIRFFAEAIHANVQWVSNEQNVIITKGEKKITIDLTLKTLLTHEGSMLTDSIYVKDNRIMVPYRFIANYFDYKVSYIGKGPIARAYNQNALLEDEEIYYTMQDQVNKEKERIILDTRNKAQEETIRRFRQQNAESKIAYITFDDGPSIYTDKILDILNAYDAKATFFMLSNNIQKYPDSVQKLVDHGNAVGLHGVTHDVKKIYKSPSSVVAEMTECNHSLQKAVGFRTDLIRVPYGSKPYMTQRVKDEVVKAGYKMWDWNIDSKDSSRKNVEPITILENVKQQVLRQKVPVILLHERKSTVQALPDLLGFLHEKNYILVPINDNVKPVNFWTKSY